MSEAITGLILAGGLGRRMGGVDKGLQYYKGRTLVEQVAERLAPQVDRLFINANRSREIYGAMGYPVISDQILDFPGPLAGLHAGLKSIDTPLLLTVPCDSPRLPTDLAHRLYNELSNTGAFIAIAVTNERLHPVFCLCRRELLQPLESYLAIGGRRVAQWCNDMGAVKVEFSEDSAFQNFNTIADLSDSVF